LIVRGPAILVKFNNTCTLKYLLTHPPISLRSSAELILALIAFVLVIVMHKNASLVAACTENMHTDLRPRTKVCQIHSLRPHTHSLTLTRSFTHSLTHSLTHTRLLALQFLSHSLIHPVAHTHSLTHIGVSHLLVAGAGPQPLPSAFDAVAESWGGGWFPETTGISLL